MATLDQNQYYTDPNTGTQYTSYAVFQQNTQGVTLPTTMDPNTGQATITPESVQPAAVTPFVQPNPTTIPDVANLYSTPPLEATPEETQAQGVIDDVMALNEGIAGKAAFQSDQENKFGVGTASNTLNDLNAKLIGLKNEQAAIPLLLERASSSQGVSSTIIDRQRSSLLRDNAIQALSVSAMMAAASGQLVNAQSMADRAVAAKFGPDEAKRDALLNNLNLILNSPDYDRSQKNRAQKQLDIQNEKAAKLEQQKADFASIQTIALDAAKNGADAETLTKIQASKTPIEAAAHAQVVTKQIENKEIVATAGITTPFVNKNGEFFNTTTGKPFESPEEFFRAAGVTSFEEAYKKGLVTDFTIDKLADREFASQARAKYLDAGINLNDSPDIVRQKVMKSPSWQAEQADTGFTLSEGQVRYDAEGNVVAVGPQSTPTGGYSEDQLKVITKINQDVSKNATYAKTTSMRSFADNVTASLQQGTGVGDIAAINQFQKVIDEGAVTRDQDVALIQGSQSFLNTLKTKIKKLEKGEQLSPELRNQMRDSVEKLYDAQVKALLKDPYITAKTKEAELYGLNASDTILSELGGFEREQPKSVEQLMIEDPEIRAAVDEMLRQGIKYDVAKEAIQEQLGLPKTVSSTNKTTTMRTDRHNNPTAFTTDIAKLAGLKEGVDYVTGDSFSNGKYQTANLLGDAIATTIEVIDKIGFKTSSGKNRWTYTDSIPETKKWKSLSYEQKKKVIAKMYQHEGGSALKQYFA